MQQFPFFGHGKGSETTYDVMAVAREPTSFLHVRTVVAEWGSTFGLKVQVRADVPGLFAFTTSAQPGRKGAGSLDGLEQLLGAAHLRVPLSFVVRTNRVTPSARHHESVSGVAALLTDVRPFLVGPYDEPRLTASGGQEREAHLALLESLSQDPPAQAFHRAFSQAARTMNEPQRAVWRDVVQEQVPGLLGRRFSFDVIFLAMLADARGVGFATLQVPASFGVAQSRVFATHNRPMATAFDWANTAAVAALLEGAPTARQWRDLEQSLDEVSVAHQQTVFALSHDARLKLLPYGEFTTRLANVANHFAMRGDLESARVIYDSVVEAKQLHPASCTTLLHVAAEENTASGVNERRTRRYLQASLLHRAQNPLICLNAAELFCQLGEVDEGLTLLEEARAAGVAVWDFRNDAAFEGVRELPRFVAVMKSGKRKR